MKIPRRRTSPRGEITREQRSQNLKDQLYRAATKYLEIDPFDSDERTDQEHELATLCEQLKALIPNMPAR